MGAGVILVEHYILRHPLSNAVTRSGLTVILFREKRTGRYSDAGGANNGGESAEQCASRELLEESVGLFDIDLDDPKITRCRISLSSGYTAFVLPVRHHNGVQKRYYVENLKSTAAAEVPYYMKETDDMRRFFVEDLVNAGMMSCNSRKAALITIPDAVDQSMCMLSKRTVCVIQKAYAHDLLARKSDWNHLHLGQVRLHNVVLSCYAPPSILKSPPHIHSVSLLISKTAAQIGVNVQINRSHPITTNQSNRCTNLNQCGKLTGGQRLPTDDAVQRV